MNRNKPRNKNFSITVTEDEYELLYQAAALEGKAGAAWGRDILMSRALRARWRGQAA